MHEQSAADNPEERSTAETAGADDDSPRDGAASDGAASDGAASDGASAATGAADADAGKTAGDDTADAGGDPHETGSDWGATAVSASSDGALTGAVAVVSAGLGLVSLTGTSLGRMLRSREQLIGRIEISTGGSGNQIEAVYGAPWDTVAFVNGVFAFVAVAVGALLLAGLTGQPNSKPWVKAVALGGVVLGLIGLLVAGGMYFDLFVSQPQLPTRPAPVPGG